MIIKKHLAQHMPSAEAPEASVIQHPQARPQPNDPYAAVSAEDFETGRLPSRRAQDRRQVYRRDNDTELISRAEVEANAIKEAAAARGFEEGLNQAQATIDALADAMNDLLFAQEKALASASDALAEMAVNIAEQIVKTEVSCDPELVLSVVKHTIARVGREQKSITIKVNPMDVQTVESQLRQVAHISESVELMVVDDTTVEPGFCMIDTQAGLIDARFRTQLDVLKRLIGGLR